MGFRLRALSGVAALAMPLAAAPAYAQSNAGAPTPPAAATLGEVIVTATRQETKLQKTPVAITALSAQTLKERGVQTLLDVAPYVPNLFVGGRGGQGINQGDVAIRAIGSDAPDSAPSVGIYVDDVYYPSVNGNLLGTFDLSRLEVLRGPQGTLFGRNTIAGAIQYVTNKPTMDRFSGFADASGGSLGSYEASGGVNIPLTSTLAMRLSGQVQQQGGYVHDELNDFDRGKLDTNLGRLQFRWVPIDRLKVDFKAETAEQRSNGRPVITAAFNPSRATSYLVSSGIIPVLPPPFRDSRPFLPSYITPEGSYDNAGEDQPDFFHLRYDAVNGVVAYNLTNDITLKSISAFSYTRAHQGSDFDGSPLAILYVDHGIDSTNLFTQELQLSGNSFSDRLNWTTGVYYYDSREKVVGYTSGIGKLIMPPEPDNEVSNKSYAGYGQATLKLIWGLSATAGVRESREDIDAIYPDDQFPTQKRHFDDTSPYFGLNWQVDPSVFLYAKASKGFRAGGFHVDPGLPNGSLFFGPETAWTYETGARLEMLDHRLRINPTLFLTDWDDIQFVYITLPEGTPIAATQNAGDARLKGVEVESQFAVTPAFQLTGSFSYLDAYYTSLAAPTPGSVPIQLSLSDPLARAPKFKYSFGGRYTLQGSTGWQAVGSLIYAWSDDTRSTVDGDQAITLPSYGLLNGRIEYTPPSKRFTLSLYATNLTNEYYLIDGLNFQSSSGVTTETPGRPREVGGSIRVAF